MTYLSFSVPKIEAKYSAIATFLQRGGCDNNYFGRGFKMASALEKRMKDREEARKTAVEQSKLDKEGEKKEEETQEYFSSRFTKLKQDIEGKFITKCSLHYTVYTLYYRCISHLLFYRNVGGSLKTR